MTQAELAGGMANAPEARPGKGQLIRDFTLTSTLGQPISLSDYRGHSNLVLIFGERETGVLTSRFWLKLRETTLGFWMSRLRCWPLCNVLAKKQPELRRKRICRSLYWSMRMVESSSYGRCR
jgi:hypothetical protein